MQAKVKTMRLISSKLPARIALPDMLPKSKQAGTQKRSRIRLHACKALQAGKCKVQSLDMEVRNNN